MKIRGKGSDKGIGCSRIERLYKIRNLGGSGQDQIPELKLIKRFITSIDPNEREIEPFSELLVTESK